METTQVEILEELTHDEERNRAQLELRVEQAFYQAGKALAQLREQRLYRSTHKTFETYCRDRFGFTRQAANYLIAGADIFENLTTNGCQILPTNECQVRSLSALEPEQQGSVINYYALHYIETRRSQMINLLRIARLNFLFFSSLILIKLEVFNGVLQNTIIYYAS
ncbi:hypothetical protein [Chroococcidiopsis sp. SAG 2025]|uniref:hypothetical protein n=1 Tax=Chroococcidiopsis sp. SAG 2025 TaxID=171389 RepID=UPI002936DA34|nr:hypothetical protein [Chroococcidiopsis sp. SAG 2025]